MYAPSLLYHFMSSISIEAITNIYHKPFSIILYEYIFINCVYLFFVYFTTQSRKLRINRQNQCDFDKKQPQNLNTKQGQKIIVR